MSAGKTRWYPRHIEPVRRGEYECHARITRVAPLYVFNLVWDGYGFIVPFPMAVIRWRGATKAAYRAAKPQPDQPAQEQASQSPQDQVKK